jgi:hypothetical protein
MGLEKAIEHGKEHRKPYYDTRSFDCTCRNHGSCIWCEENRLISKLRNQQKMNYKLKEYESDAETASL